MLASKSVAESSFSGTYPVLHPQLYLIGPQAACIKEGLRLGYGPIGRMPRVVPSHGKSFHGYPIPQGVSSASSAETGLTFEKTVVGVWNYVYHHNASIWGKDHESFNPDRWLDQTSQSLDEHLLTFGRDSFRCIGRE